MLRPVLKSESASKLIWLQTTLGHLDQKLVFKRRFEPKISYSGFH